MGKIEKISLVRVLKYAGAYIAFEIGSGFATGQEILQFYTSYGIWAIGGALVSMALFAWAGAKTMTMGYRLRERENIRPYRIICGKYIGFIFEKFVLFYVFAGLCVMISGAGASLREYFGFNHLTGSLMMTALIFLAFAFGFKKMIALIGFMGPLIIGVIIFVAGWTIISEFDDVLRNMGDSAVLEGFKNVSAAPNWWISGILYAAYNMVGSMAFLMAMGKDAKSAKEACAGGITGGVLLMITVLFVSFALLGKGHRLEGVMVPTLTMAREISPLMGAIFVGVLLCGIFSTAVPMLWTICDQLTDRENIATVLLALLVCADALVLGQLPFDKLVKVVYPITGYLGMGLFLCLVKNAKTRGGS